VVLAGLAFCTLEVAFVLIATVLICGYLRRKELADDWAFARNSALALLGAILLVWPAAILKLNFLKAYLFMSYVRVEIRQASP
jgi:asparagine N-glycosylation enzyme membrane subunit Stt3